MRISKFMLLILSVVLVGTLVAPASAQGDPSMLVWASNDVTHSQTRVVAIGDDIVGQELFSFAQADIDVHNVFISRDTQTVAMTVSTRGDGVMKVWYRRSGGEPVMIPYAQVTGFTQDSAYLLYHSALFQSFSVGIVNLSTGVQLEFVGTRTEGQGLNNGAAMPIHFDGSTLYAVGYLPSSDAPLYGLFSFDLATNTPQFGERSGRFDLPAAVAVADVAAYGYKSPVVSPDGTQIAYLVADADNPPPSDPESFLPATNMLYVVNLATKTPTLLAQAGPGQVLVGLSWMSDSRGLVFAGGSYDNINTIYTASVEGNVQPLGTVGTGEISTVAICGRYVYMTWRWGENGGLPKIQRALLSDLTAVQDVGTTDTAQLLGCSI